MRLWLGADAPGGVRRRLPRSFPGSQLPLPLSFGAAEWGHRNRRTFHPVTVASVSAAESCTDGRRVYTDYGRSTWLTLVIGQVREAWLMLTRPLAVMGRRGASGPSPFKALPKRLILVKLSQKDFFLLWLDG